MIKIKHYKIIIVYPRCMNLVNDVENKSSFIKYQNYFNILKMSTKTKWLIFLANNLVYPHCRLLSYYNSRLNL